MGKVAAGVTATNPKDKSNLGLTSDCFRASKVGCTPDCHHYNCRR